jgi:hypothetical protein
MRNGETRRAMQWTRSTYRIQTGARKTTRATPLTPPTQHLQKMHQSGAAAAMVAHWMDGQDIALALTEMAAEEMSLAPRPNLFQPGRWALRGIKGSHV